jgi:hypothetical protein
VKNFPSWVLLLGLVSVLWKPASATRLPVEILEPTGKLPAHLIQAIEAPHAYVETSRGVALVLDGAAQAVYAIDAARSTSTRIIGVGAEPGHILNPSGFAMGPNDILAIADAPGAYGRLQYFGVDGRLIGTFYLGASPGPRLALGRLSVGGAGPLAFDGRTFLFNTPSTGALMSAFNVSGEAVRSIGTLRPTGHETDAPLHAALNAGLPLVDPTGGYYFVFETGTPMFRRYDASGALVFQRHIEGPELDADLRALPTRWRERPADDSAWPLAPSLVQTAGVDGAGRLWVALRGGAAYVYDRDGDKIRTVRFESPTGPVLPVSLFFARHGRVLVAPWCYEYTTG